ncbi:hypothetical protein LCGC14_3111320 [marine sediment metagenome]|uniref:Uncharacterized protein n=1 Tax=marine sediment metagenome TaxID=412755 RepID=A0A0F8WTV0_9ZZZZ
MAKSELERFSKKLEKLKAEKEKMKPKDDFAPINLEIRGVSDRVKFLNKGKRNARKKTQAN